MIGDSLNTREASSGRNAPSSARQHSTSERNYSPLETSPTTTTKTGTMSSPSPKRIAVISVETPSISRSLEKLMESTDLIPVVPPQEMILEALDELAKVLREAQPGIATPAARKLQRRFARQLSLYFRKLGRSLPYRDLPGYLAKHRKVKEAADTDAMKIAGKATSSMNKELKSVLDENIKKGYGLGVTEAHQVYRLEPTFGVENPVIIKWMRNRSAEMVTKIDETTRQRLANTLTRGAKAGDSPAKLAKRIRTEVASMADISRGRSHLIATTELNNAMSEANLETYTRLGIAGKSWSTTGDDRVSDECIANEAAGIIPMDRAFPSGPQRPPQHPGCRCTLVPERMGKPAPTGEEK